MAPAPAAVPPQELACTELEADERVDEDDEASCTALVTGACAPHPEHAQPPAASEGACGCVCSTSRPPFSFEKFAERLDVQHFLTSLRVADLTANHIDCCQSALTLFAPTDEAFKRLGERLPQDVQVLRDLLSVHIVPGSYSHADLLTTKSVTSVSHQTHHVLFTDGENLTQVLQVGSASLVKWDYMLPDGRGVLHVVDSVMCCIRLLQHCRFEQVWNKTVRPSPRVELLGEWRPRVDELHAILVHCDTWQPRLKGLRGAVVPLNKQSGERNKSFQDGIVYFSELLILEKPPEMSKRKRKKKLDGIAGDEREGSGNSSHYRFMFSMCRRATEADGSAAAAVGDGCESAGATDTSPGGSHLTFCMAPEDILIRNSFHMLSEAEKDARRAEYKALSDGSTRSKHGAPRRPPLMLQAMPASASALEVSRPDEFCAEEREPDAQQQPPPVLIALSLTSGPRMGGAEVWAQGRCFSGSTHIYLGGLPAPRVQVVSDTLLTFQTPALPQGSSAVQVFATNTGKAWSNPLPFGISSGPDSALSGNGALMERQLSLLQLFVRACCGAGAEGSVTQLMSPMISQTHRLLGAVLALILAGSGGVHCRGGALDLERQDSWGCTLMHYVCASRNESALQLLLRAAVDPNIRDNQGMSVLDWARAFSWPEGEQLILQSAAQPAARSASAAGGTVMGSGNGTMPCALIPGARQLTEGCRAPCVGPSATGCSSFVPRASPGDSLDGQHAASQGMRGFAAAPAESGASCAGSQLQLLHLACVRNGVNDSQGADTVSEASRAPATRPNSLAQFLEPRQSSSCANHDVRQASLAGFLTAAAAHVESGPAR